MRSAWLHRPRHQASWRQSVFPLLHTNELSEGLDEAMGALIRMVVWRRFPKSPTFLLFTILLPFHPNALKCPKIIKKASRRMRIVKKERAKRIIIQIPKIHTHAVVEVVF